MLISSFSDFIKLFLLFFISCILWEFLGLFLNSLDKRYARKKFKERYVQDNPYEIVPICSGSIVFPLNYRKEYIGFYGSSGTEIMNLTSSTITGQFILEDGTTYTVRAQSFSRFQYQSEDGYYNNYYDLNVSTIYNTNVQFEDSLSDRANTVYDFTIFEQLLISLVIIFGIVIIVILFFKK